LFAVADGVGGHAHGEVASRIAVETLLAGFPKAPAGESHTTLLERLVKSANSQIIEAGHTAGATSGSNMATTVVACALRYDRAAVAHVGDSRCYLVRHGKAHIITRDHTVVNEQVRLGVINAKEAAESASRHLLNRSLGNDLFVNVDVSEHQIMPGDSLLLCSDGMHGSVEPADIAAALAGDVSVDDAAHSLVALAKERDGGDNITVQVVRVRDVERVGMYRGRPYKLR
jgi:protein phosphatase